MNNAVMIGSNPGYPKMYFNSDIRKKVEIFASEQVYGKHYEILTKHKVKEKLAEDVTISKVLSILAFNLFEIVNATGLLKGKPEIIKNLGFQKYKFTND